MPNKSVLIKILMPLALSVAVIIGVFLGIHFSNSQNRSVTALQIYPRTDKISTLLNYVEQEYVDEISRKDLEEKAIPKIISELDPHSVYIPASELTQVNEPLEGNFSGIGIQFNMQNDTVAVISTITNGPSEKIGLQAGDRIILVNGEVVSGVKLPSDSIVRRLKGPRGTKVKVGIKRHNVDKMLDFEIIRDNIPLYSVDVAYMLDNTTGFIKINKFSRTTHAEFQEKVRMLKQQGCRELIVDLRGNGGGYLDAATNIADEFLDEGQLIVYTEGKARPRSNSHATKGGLCIGIEVAVLIDEFSASASEILAGAIQDNDRGLVIGRRSFGKGLVQEQIMLPDGSALRLTIARYYTPTGRSIQKPYTNGDSDDYEADIMLRYQHGEFEHADSILFDDSLKYTTPKGRTVYGGGGIMPDVFVPLDTVGYSSYFEKIRNSGLIYRFAFDYVDRNRTKLKTLKTPVAIVNYLKKDKVLAKFIDYVQANGIPRDRKGLKISQVIIENQLYAYIARNIIDNEGFYPIIENIDNTLQRAREELKKMK